MVENREYRYTCTECYEEIYSDRSDLTICEHCLHQLRKPIEVTEIGNISTGHFTRGLTSKL